jgi:hypothetical protein
VPWISMALLVMAFLLSIESIHPNAAIAATKEVQSTRGVLLSEWCC